MQILKTFPVRKVIVLASITFLILFIIFRSLVNIADFTVVLRGVSWVYFFVAFALMVPITLLGVTRWYWVVHAAGLNVPFSKIFKIVISSISLGVIPGRLGDLARSYPLRKTIPIPQTIGTIVIEKIIDICVLVVFSGVGLLTLGYLISGTTALVLAALAVPALELTHRVSRKLSLKNTLAEKVHDAVSVLDKVKERKAVLFLAILTSFLNWTLSVLQVYWLFRAVGAAVPLSAVYTFHPLSTFAGLIPITLAGVGTRDSALIYFFRDFASPEHSLATGILYSLQAYWLIALMGAPLLFYFFRDKPDS